MKQNTPNPFLIEKYFDDVKSQKIKAQDAVNLTSVLANNKLETLRMIKNAGVTNIKDLYQKCSKNFEKITKQKPRANMFAQYAIKRPKQDIQYSKQVDQRKIPYRKTESAGKSLESNEPIRKNSRTNSKDYYEKIYNLQEGDNQKLMEDILQMMLIMAEHIQHSQDDEEEIKKKHLYNQSHPHQQQSQQQQQQQQHQSNNGQQHINQQQNQLFQQPSQIQQQTSQLLKRKNSIPQIRIIVSSPPKEVQSVPDLTQGDHIKLDEPLQNYKVTQASPYTSSFSNMEEEEEDDEDIPDDGPLNIIESTIFKFSQQYFDVSRISGHIREHIVQL